MPKKKYKDNKFSIKVVIVARLLCGPFLFIAPLITTAMMFAIDWADGEIFKRAKYTHDKYNQIDKILDFY